MAQSTTASLAVLAFLGLGACATPGIDYEARLMATSAEAAATRDVVVDGFAGPLGGWYSARFEAMLANAVFDGQPWFRFADYAVDVPGERVGIYTGETYVDDYSWNEYTRIVKKCVEWDGLFDCETRAEVEELCFEEDVRVSVTPRLIDQKTGEVLFSKTYYGDAGSEECHEIGYHGHKGYNKHGRRGLFSFDYVAPPGLVQSALAETLRPIRVDIAPRNAIVRAEFVTEALDPVAKADPLFQQGIDAVKRDPYTSCAIWQMMSETHPNAPAVIHNMGACAEASSDFITAQGHYARAAELSTAMGANNELMRPFLKSLQKLSDQRFGLEQIEAARGDYITVPSDELEPRDPAS